MKINHKRQEIDQYSNERALDEISVELATSCNLTCKMCSAWKTRKPVIAHDKILSLLDEARALGAVRFVSCGTEPFIRDDILEILDYADSAGFQEICTVSNGLLLNNSKKLDALERLKSLNIVISLDGPKDVHDDLRGKGTFDSAMETLRELRKRGITCSMASIIMRQTIDRLHEIVDIAADLGIPVISMQPYQRETAGLDSDHSPFEFRSDEESYINKKLTRLLCYADRKKIRVYTSNMLSYVPAYLARGIRHIPPGGCHVPSRLMIVENSGACYPCFMMRERLRSKSMGNANEKPLYDIWHSDVHQELNLMALNRTCPGCLASCGDVDSYDKMAQRGWLARNIARVYRRFSVI